ncbi:MAG: MarR family transcriptional regulator [Spirosoma sp.]|nr:MarR family transcriptional regulator [Spirosoma sp.]
MLVHLFGVEAIISVFSMNYWYYNMFKQISFKRNLFEQMLVIYLPRSYPTMDKHYRNIYHQLIANLHKTDGYIFNYFAQKLAPFELSVQQYIVLRRLSEAYPNSLTAGELKEKMTDVNSDMTRLIDRLVAKNLVLREVDPNNRRRVNLRLTDESNRFTEAAAVEFKDFESIVSHLTDDEVHLMNTLLNKIRNGNQ